MPATHSNPPKHGGSHFRLGKEMSIIYIYNMLFYSFFFFGGGTVCFTALHHVLFQAVFLAAILASFGLDFISSCASAMDLNTFRKGIRDEHFSQRGLPEASCTLPYPFMVSKIYRTQRGL